MAESRTTLAFTVVAVLICGLSGFVLASELNTVVEARDELTAPVDVRFTVAINTDQLSRPVDETEATHLYE